MLGSIAFGWNEVAIIITIGAFWMTVVLTIIGTLAKYRSGQASTPIPRSQAPQAHSPARARSQILVAILVLVVLNLCAPLPWLLFGQGGMPLVKLIVIGILLASIYIVFAVAIALRAQLSTAEASPKNETMRSSDLPLDTQLVARITLRFCPRCRAPLAADAPE